MSVDILTPFHKKVLRIFTGLEESKAFYFTGAMALSAYYLQHRLSEDIDIFCPEENLIPIVSRKFTQVLARENVDVRVVRSFGDFWEAVLKQDSDEIRFQLAYDTPFLLNALSDQDGLHVHSLDDLAAGKLQALFTRAEERDFIDVYLLVKEAGYTVRTLIDLARRKDPGLDEYYLALAFAQVDRLPSEAAALRVTLLRPVDLTDLKTFFRNQAIELLRERLQK